MERAPRTKCKCKVTAETGRREKGTMERQSMEESSEQWSENSTVLGVGLTLRIVGAVRGVLTRNSRRKGEG